MLLSITTENWIKTRILSSLHEQEALKRFRLDLKHVALNPAPAIF
jgi:hypothetical protein